MKRLLASIDLVIECRDYRTPLVSRNPLFEQNLGERPRLVVYTKQDLGSHYTPEDRKVCMPIRMQIDQSLTSVERGDCAKMGCADQFYVLEQ